MPRRYPLGTGTLPPHQGHGVILCRLRRIYYLPRFAPNSRLTALISSNTSSLVSSPFRTNTRREASVSNIIARGSSSKVTTWRGSSFSAIPQLTTSSRSRRDSPSLFLLHLGDPSAAIDSILDIDHLVLRPSDGCRDHQGAGIGRNRDTCIAPKIPSLTFLAASVASLPPCGPF